MLFDSTQIYISLIVIAGLIGGIYCDDFRIGILYEKEQQEKIDFLKNSLSTGNTTFPVTFEGFILEEDEDELQQINEKFSNGISLLLDFTWSGNEMANNVARNSSIPYIHLDVSIAPFLRLLDAYLDARNCTDVLIIFDKEEYIDQAAYFWIDSPRLRMVFRNEIDEKAARSIKKIRPIPNSFAILADAKNMSVIFQQSQDQELTKLSDRWHLVLNDFQYKNFDKTLLKNSSISLLYLNEELCCNILNKQQCTCPEDFNFERETLTLFSRVIREIVEGMILNKNTDDVGALTSETYEKFEEILDKVIGEHKFFFSRVGNTIGISVQGDVEKFYNGSFQVTGQYTSGRFKFKKDIELKPVKPFYRIGIAHAIPWSYKAKHPDTQELYWTGYCADFTQKLSEIMNFDYEFVEPESRSFGEKINGTWNGVVGDLARGDTDMAITAMIMTADKEEVIDFVAPYYEQTGISIVMRKPVRKTSLFKFMTVLKLEVWFSIVAALIVTGLMVWFLDKYSPYSAKNNKKAYFYPCREFTLKESFWFALTSFTPQGGGEAPKALSGRTLVAAYWLFVVLMLATFTANLAAFLTVERMQAPVQSLEQLARQSRINYTVVQNSETHNYFINMKNAEDTLYRMWKELTLNASTDDSRYRVWDYPIREQYGHILLAINDSNPVVNAIEGFKKVDEHLDADFAFIHDSSEIKYEISKNCNFTEVGEVFAEKPYAVAVQQGSHLQDELSKIILDLQKDRFFEQLQAKYWNHSAKGDCPSIDDNEGITLESLGGVFIATLFGLALAMLTLVGEVFYYKRKGKKDRTKIEQMANLNFKKVAAYPPKYNSINPNFGIEDNFKKANISTVSLYPKARNRIAFIE